MARAKMTKKKMTIAEMQKSYQQRVLMEKDLKMEKLIINKLFGVHDYELELQFPEKVRIIHAQNGMGKTTVLSMIPAILSLDIDFLDNVPFKSVKIELSNGESIVVEKKYLYSSIWGTETDTSSDNSFLDPNEYLLRSDKQNALNGTIYNEKANARRQIERNSIFYILTDENGNVRKYKVFVPSENWLYEDLMEIDERKKYYYFREVEHQDEKRIHERTAKSNRDFLHKMNHYRLSLPFNIIKADRLHNYEDAENESYFSSEPELKKYAYHKEKDGNISTRTEAILDCANSIKGQIAFIKQRKEEISEQLDRTFPARVIEQYKTKEDSLEQEVKGLFFQLEKRRAELEQVGLISDEKDGDRLRSNQVYPKAALPVLKLYAEDNIKKLDVYELLKKKIYILLKAINKSNKFYDKRLEISPGDGMVFKSNRDDRKIPLEQLSSGEKHAVIMFFNLIFKSRRNAIVFIDEPEISLHIAWQRHFISSLIEICRINDLHAIVATHSPDIIEDHWDLLYNLNGLPDSMNDEEE